MVRLMMECPFGAGSRKYENLDERKTLLGVRDEMNTTNDDAVDRLRVCTPWSGFWAAGDNVGDLG
jgi:hypothetical protein